MEEQMITDKNVELLIMEWTITESTKPAPLGTNARDIFPQHKHIMCSSG